MAGTRKQQLRRKRRNGQKVTSKLRRRAPGAWSLKYGSHSSGIPVR